MKNLLKRILPAPVRRLLVGSYIVMNRFVVFVMYLGFSRRCPMCGWSFSSFLPGNPELKGRDVVENTLVGGGYRKDGACPRCYAGDRERSVYWALKNLGLFDKNGEALSVLHVAPERKLRQLIEKAARVESYTGTDIDLDVSAATEQMNITDIRKPSNVYDVVICNHVLEHIIDDQKAMRELFRVLKPNGFAILQTPISRVLKETFEDAKVTTEEDRRRVFGQRDHVRIYAKDYADRLKKAGFVLELRTNEEWYGKATSFYYGLIPDEVMYLGRKS